MTGNADGESADPEAEMDIEDAAFQTMLLQSVNLFSEFVLIAWIQIMQYKSDTHVYKGLTISNMN